MTCNRCASLFGGFSGVIIRHAGQNLRLDRKLSVQDESGVASHSRLQSNKSFSTPIPPKAALSIIVSRRRRRRGDARLSVLSGGDKIIRRWESIGWMLMCALVTAVHTASLWIRTSTVQHLFAGALKPPLASHPCWCFSTHLARPIPLVSPRPLYLVARLASPPASRFFLLRAPLMFVRYISCYPLVYGPADESVCVCECMSLLLPKNSKAWLKVKIWF